MSILNEIISHHKPDNWEDANYNAKRFHKFELGPHDNEYDDIARNFGNLPILRIERIQNPYIMGRYLLRKEQLKLRDGYVNERTAYHPLSVEDIEVAAEHNCDVRRYTNNLGERKPCFYNSAQKANDNFSTTSEKAIMVVKLLGSESYFDYGTTPNTETEFYPIYIVYLQ